MSGLATNSRPPADCGIAFKEWSSVCLALAEGRQSLIFRKGGIAEESGSFRPEHPAFWLYPTFFHQAAQGTSGDADAGRPDSATPPGTLALTTLAVVDLVAWADDLDRLDLLRGFHTWDDEAVRKKFHYRKPGLWVLGLRAFRRPEPWCLPIDVRYDGCKTWVELNLQLSCDGLVAALSDRDHARRMEEIRSVLDRPPGIGP